jgi:MFS family permease
VLGGVMGPISGTLADKFGPRWVSVIGLVLISTGTLLLSMLDHQTPIWRFALSVAPLGLGMGFFSSANNSAVLNSVPRERLGVASGLLSLARTLGQSTGVPIAAALFGVIALGHAGVVEHDVLLRLPPESLVRGTQAAFRVASCTAAIAACIAIWMLLRDRKAAK